MYPPCISLGRTGTALTEGTLAGSVYEAAKRISNTEQLERNKINLSYN